MFATKRVSIVFALAILLTSCSNDEKFGSLENQSGATSAATEGAQAGATDSNGIPLAMENLGFKLGAFDATSGLAGDLKITGVTIPVAPDNDPNKDYLNESYQYLMSRYGANDMGKQDVQMSFFLPLGTKVISMVTGTVCDVAKLYSNDYSVRIAPKGVECFPEGMGGANVLFEHEHVLNPSVKYGDAVTAGQVIADVSDYRKEWKQNGFGIVEIGVFFAKSGSNAPWHACPVKYLAPDKKDQILSDLSSAYTAWESELGKSDLYDESAQFASCLTTDDLTDSNDSSTGTSSTP